ncbi:ankyrin [Ophiobolus disseminans]|uniref:Ankyrin n=1 Tax=Ophiobolus disseminans TaxID=1469910 RepID=A0A6A6ZUJ4_9PLEO|nr:ankyrin [Ophiobolus disseminans]
MNVAFDGANVEYYLKRCVEEGQLDTVAHAIQLGAHPEGNVMFMSSRRSKMPIKIACRWGRIDVVECLLGLGADPKGTVAIAVGCGHTRIVERLLLAGIAPVDVLSKAAARGHLDIVRLLLDVGVDANETIGPGSPLASAISREHKAMFRLLIEREADVYATGVAEECMRRARKEGLESMLLLLKEHGVDIGEDAYDAVQ